MYVFSSGREERSGDEVVIAVEGGGSFSGLEEEEKDDGGVSVVDCESSEGGRRAVEDVASRRGVDFGDEV